MKHWTTYPKGCLPMHGYTCRRFRRSNGMQLGEAGLTLAADLSDGMLTLGDKRSSVARTCGIFAGLRGQIPSLAERCGNET